MLIFCDFNCNPSIYLRDINLKGSFVILLCFFTLNNITGLATSKRGRMLNQGFLGFRPQFWWRQAHYSIVYSKTQCRFLIRLICYHRRWGRISKQMIWSSILESQKCRSLKTYLFVSLIWPICNANGNNLRVYEQVNELWRKHR